MDFNKNHTICREEAPPSILATKIHYGIDGLPTVTIDGKVVSKFLDCSIKLGGVVEGICGAWAGAAKPTACARH
jgi:hypothetical protein